LTLGKEKGTVLDDVSLRTLSLPRALALGLLCGPALLGLSLDARAEGGPSPQQIKAAAEEFDRGIKAAQAGDFEGAATHFEGADREAPSPDAIKAAIRARRDAKQGARAATLANLALNRYAQNKELATFARGVIEQSAKGLHKVAVTCKPECVLVVDSKLVPSEAAAEITVFLDPGKHAVNAGWGDKTQSREVVATAGGSSSLSFAPPKAEPVASATPAVSASSKAPATAPSSTTDAPPAASGSGFSPAVAYVGFGLTAVLAGVSVWSGLDAKSNPGTAKVKEQCVGLGESCPVYQDGLSRQKRTNVLLGVTGGAALVTGVIALFLTDWKSGGPPESTAARGPQAPRGFVDALGLRQVGVVPGFDGQSATIHATGQF
jgi:hypothetical protein